MASCPEPNKHLFRKIQSEIKHFEIIINKDKAFNGGNPFAGPLSIIFFTVALFKNSKEEISRDCFRNLNEQYASFDLHGNEEYVDDMVDSLFVNPEYIFILALFLYKNRNGIRNLRRNALELIQLFRNHAGRLLENKNTNYNEFEKYDQLHGRENITILANHRSSPIINSPSFPIQQVFQDNEVNDIFVDGNANHGSRSLRSVKPSMKWSRNLDGNDNGYGKGRYVPIPTARRALSRGGRKTKRRRRRI